MSLRKMNKVIDTIKACRRKEGGLLFSAYLGTNPITKQVVRFYGSNRVDLVARVKSYYEQVKETGILVTMLTETQVLDAKTALDALAKAGLKLTLTECAKRSVAVYEAEKRISTVSLGEAYDAFIAEKEAESSSNDVKTTKSRTGKWVELTGRSVRLADITCANVEEYLKKTYGDSAHSTYNGVLQYLNIFFNWCTKKPRKYIPENPLDGLKGKKVVWVEPKCITPKDAEILFRALESVKDTMPHYLAYAILSFFCGIRREEILRIAGKTEANDCGGEEAAVVNLETRVIRILKPKGYLKGVAPRAFDIPDTAYAWMRSFDFLSAIRDIGEKTVDGVYRIGREHGAEIPKNCGRHSFITHHVVAYGSLERTLLIAGTSEGMSEDHYRALRSSKDGEAYFSILPSSARS